MKPWLLSLCIVWNSLNLQAQFGTNQRYSFSLLELSNSARSQYLGKASALTYDQDLSLTYHNPSLIDRDMRGHIHFSTAAYLGSYIASLGTIFDIKSIEMPLMVQGNFIIYQEQNFTNIEGNRIGIFSPYELVLATGTAFQYDKYRLGGQVKFMMSDFFLEKQIGIAMDLSATYVNPYHQITAALLLKNIGHQLYSSSGLALWPTKFDLQFGISHKLKHLPFKISLLGHSLNILDPAISSDNYLISPYIPFYRLNNHIANTILSHLVVSGELHLGKALRLGFSYDFMKNEELRYYAFRGLAGFAFGGQIQSKRFNIGYSIGKASTIGESHMVTVVYKPNL
ncbi:MAG: hypothetical protein MUE53_08450 [Chitinophagales bacterium]|nr:hypothetical protein [Chitinophagales bacterium]